MCNDLTVCTDVDQAVPRPPPPPPAPRPSIVANRNGEKLGISPSYLNHLERNQRPVTAPLLLKLAELYDIDVRAFAAGGGTRTGPDALAEIFSDTLLSDLGVPRYELAELANNAPAVADAIARLYTAVKEAERNPSLGEGGDARALVTPESWVRDYIQQHRNHYPALEEAAETLGGALSDPLSMAEPMRRRLKDAWGISASVVPQAELGNVSQLYDPDRRQFIMSSQLRAENRTFALAYQLALVEFAAVIERMVVEAAPPDDGHPPAAAHEPRQLCGRGDHDALRPLPRQRRAVPLFDRPAVRRIWRQRRAGGAPADDPEPAGRAGVPFFMLRVDPAGNISKRYAGENFPFSRFGGTCPRWNLHAAFQTAGQAVTQLIETPDGQRYFTVARTIERPIKTELGARAAGDRARLRHPPRAQIVLRRRSTTSPMRR